MTKLKLDISTGVLEVEGEEAFVREIYTEFKDRLVATPLKTEPRPAVPAGSAAAAVHQPSPSSQSRSTTPQQRGGGARKEAYKIVADLNLTPKDGQSLNAFYAEKQPSSAMEHNAVFVYFLEKKLQRKQISVNDVYTCYKDTKSKIPGALVQSLKDTSHRQGWINTADMGNLTVTTRGENLIELELPPASKKSVTK